MKNNDVFLTVFCFVYVLSLFYCSFSILSMLKRKNYLTYFLRSLLSLGLVVHRHINYSC
jgi:hypothetical protein